MVEPKDYTYETQWSDEDGAFVCRVADFPFLAAHGDTAAEALAEAKGVVRRSLEVLAEERQLPPPPKKQTAP